MKKNLIFKVCFVGVMSALFVLLDMLSLKLGNNIKITFGGLPILITAFYLNPLYGGIAGLLGAILGQVFTGYGFTVTTVFWVLPAFMRGITAGYIFKGLNKINYILKISVAVVASSLVVTVFNTFAMYIDSVIFGYAWQLVIAETLFRFLLGIITSAVYIIIIIPLLKALNGLIKR